MFPAAAVRPHSIRHQPIGLWPRVVVISSPLIDWLLRSRLGFIHHLLDGKYRLSLSRRAVNVVLSHNRLELRAPGGLSFFYTFQKAEGIWAVVALCAGNQNAMISSGGEKKTFIGRTGRSQILQKHNPQMDSKAIQPCFFCRCNPRSFSMGF